MSDFSFKERVTRLAEDEIIELLQENVAAKVANNNFQELFDKKLADVKEHLEDREDYWVQTFVLSAIENAPRCDKEQMVYDAIEDTVDEVVKEILSPMQVSRDEAYERTL